MFFAQDIPAVESLRIIPFLHSLDARRHAIISDSLGVKMIDPTLISKLTVFLTGWGAAFLIAFWLGLIFWTYRDIRSRSGDKLMQVLALLVVTILFLPGVLVYIILRPQNTIEEEYQKSLEEEALLHTIESSPHCPGCGKRTNPKWMVCPDCHTPVSYTHLTLPTKRIV